MNDAVLTHPGLRLAEMTNATRMSEWEEILGTPLPRVQYDTPSYLVETARDSVGVSFLQPTVYLTYVASSILEPKEGETLRRWIDRLGDQWEEITLGCSVFRRASRHPVYASLIALSDDAIALALQRLSGDCPTSWLYFLEDAEDGGPVFGDVTIDEASEAWKQWGRARGYL